MLVTTREAMAWYPLIAATALIVASALTRPTFWFAVAGVVFETRIYERIQELRTQHGIKVDTAVAFVADQEHVDEGELLEAHFAYLIDRYSQHGDENKESTQSVENS